MSAIILKSETIEELSQKADEILKDADHQKLKMFFDSHSESEHIFESLVDEAHFYYILGNCAQVLYSYHTLDWFSDELTKSVIFFRKALHALQQIDLLNEDDLYLRSCIETNLGNTLSNQGRTFCSIPFWDSAMNCRQNPVPILSKANNELFLAHSLYDSSHKNYHYFTAYQLILLGLKHPYKIDSEINDAYSEDGYLMEFKAWFESNFQSCDFTYFDSYKVDFKSRKQRDYLKWCASNRLFINDLNDVSVAEIVYTDIVNLPSITQKINPCLSMYEMLNYHGNFDELKTDYCYARYLIFSAKDIPDDHTHFFNQTYSHVDDMSYSIINLKTSHYKSAFRILYSLFDKIAYFLNRFFDLNDIEKDYKINFDSIFRKINDKKWKPHIKLKDSQNHFIHALFYVLKDIRDVTDSTSVSQWIDPDAKAFTQIRNAIEHRSLKIVDDFGYTLTQSDTPFKELQVENLKSKIDGLQNKIKELCSQIILEKKTKNDILIKELEIQKEILNEELKSELLKLNEKQKLSSHSILIKITDFESRLMTLMKLARNSIMYLSLAIHFEEQNKPNTDTLMMNREVPLKDQ